MVIDMRLGDLSFSNYAMLCNVKGPPTFLKYYLCASVDKKREYLPTLNSISRFYLFFFLPRNIGAVIVSCL